VQAINYLVNGYPLGNSIFFIQIITKLAIDVNNIPVLDTLHFLLRNVEDNVVDSVHSMEQRLSLGTDNLHVGAVSHYRLDSLNMK